MAEPLNPTRRTVVTAAAWSLPALAAAIAAPAAAASLDHTLSATGVMTIDPVPASPSPLSFDVADDTSYIFDASAIFSSPAGDVWCDPITGCTETEWTYRLYWTLEAASGNPIDSFPPFPGEYPRTVPILPTALVGVDTYTLSVYALRGLDVFGPYVVQFTLTNDGG